MEVTEEEMGDRELADASLQPTALVTRSTILQVVELSR